ncbi:GDSL-type esterase/lipase family protein [Halobacillus sp. B23F22_1]|uniref:GDSL-type esterase/lipase family protein n=1 Tax=Halobacillus sp. B23F22_1 TaxID=3459514 RepID=UPI00373ED830
MKMMKKFTVFVLIFTLFASMPLTASAKGPVKKEVDYVALGDSLAAGITPFNRLGSGYPDYLTKRMEQSQYKVDYDNFAVPGQNSSQLLNGLHNEKILEDIKEAEYVTINIGANDLLPLITQQHRIPQALNNLSTNLKHTLDLIESTGTHANIYIMGYYNPFPYAPQEQQIQFEGLLDQLNNVIESTTYRYGHTYVPTERLIAKRYERYLPNPDNIHLSEAGYQAVAKEFWKKLDKSKN